MRLLEEGHPHHMRLIHLSASNSYYRYDLIRFPDGRVRFIERHEGRICAWASRSGREAWNAFRQARWTLH